MTTPQIILVKFSERRYVLVHVASSTGEVNLQMASDRELGSEREMIPLVRGTIMTKPLSHADALYVYSYIQQNKPLPDKAAAWLTDDASLLGGIWPASRGPMKLKEGME